MENVKTIEVSELVKIFNSFFEEGVTEYQLKSRKVDFKNILLKKLKTKRKNKENLLSLEEVQVVIEYLEKYLLRYANGDKELVNLCLDVSKLFEPTVIAVYKNIKEISSLMDISILISRKELSDEILSLREKFFETAFDAIHAKIVFKTYIISKIESDENLSEEDIKNIKRIISIEKGSYTNESSKFINLCMSVDCLRDIIAKNIFLVSNNSNLVAFTNKNATYVFSSLDVYIAIVDREHERVIQKFFEYNQFPPEAEEYFLENASEKLIREYCEMYTPDLSNHHLVQNVLVGYEQYEEW